jgi:hypothetical protein
MTIDPLMPIPHPMRIKNKNIHHLKTNIFLLVLLYNEGKEKIEKGRREVQIHKLPNQRNTKN